jgi:hypothetical protein
MEPSTSAYYVRLAVYGYPLVFATAVLLTRLRLWTRPIDGRVVAIAVLVVILLSGARGYAQSTQHDCIGDAGRVMYENYTQAKQTYQDLVGQYSYWYRAINPTALLIQAGIGYEYWARQISAGSQAVACSALPIH